MSPAEVGPTTLQDQVDGPTLQDQVEHAELVTELIGEANQLAERIKRRLDGPVPKNAALDAEAEKTPDLGMVGNLQRNHQVAESQVHDLLRTLRAVVVRLGTNENEGLYELVRNQTTLDELDDPREPAGRPV